MLATLEYPASIEIDQKSLVSSIFTPPSCKLLTGTSISWQSEANVPGGGETQILTPLGASLENFY